MKRIDKGAEPEFLVAFKAGQSPDWRPSFAALSSDKELRARLKQALLVEQGFLCCYCCRRVDANRSHFEHFLCQDDFPERDLDYGNLLASCTTEGRDRCCGAKKSNTTIEVSPLDADCEARFRFDLQGGVYAARPADRAAALAIEVLGLGGRLLKEQRRQAIAAFTEGIDELSEQDIEKLLTGLRGRDDFGRFVAFQPAVVQVLGRGFLKVR